MATIMNKLNDRDAFAAAIYEAEMKYRENAPACGWEDIYAGFDIEKAKEHTMFTLDADDDIVTWSAQWCSSVLEEAENNWEERHGCYEFDCGSNMLCCARNITFGRFVLESFEDGLEFLGTMETLHRMEDGSCDFTMEDVMAGKRDND